MNTKQVETISKLLRDSREGELPRASAQERARAIGALEEALVARSKRRVRARAAWGALAAAAIVAGVFGAAKLAHRDTNARAAQSPPAPVATNAEAVSAQPAERAELARGLSLTDGSVLQPGSRIVAPQKRHAVLSFSSGTELTVGGGGDITVVEAGDVQRFLLSSGTISAHVAKLSGGQRWLVSTPDAEVEVRGTSFVVSIVPPDPSCGNGTRTRVSVSEGVVSVRSHESEVRVHPGEVWPSGCRRTASLATNAPSAPPTAAAAEHAAESDVGGAPNSAPTATSHSTLAEQNDAFARIVAFRQHGDMTGCVSEADRFLARYPQSPLAESARVEQMRALRISDPTRAVTAARDYLTQYPHGFARAEAQSIAQK